MGSFKLKKLIMVLSVTLSSFGLVACGGSGDGQNPLIDGISGPNVEMIDGRFILSMAFHNVNLDGGITLPIPKYPNSSLSVGPDFETDGLLIVLTVSIEDFVDVGSIGLVPNTLPGGRPLPGVGAGELPSVALHVPEVLNSTFYVGPSVLGFFVPFDKLDIAGSILTFRFFDTDGKRVGNLSLVGSDNDGLNAGILALINIDLRIQTAIDNHMASL